MVDDRSSVDISAFEEKAVVPEEITMKTPTTILSLSPMTRLVTMTKEMKTRVRATADNIKKEMDSDRACHSFKEQLPCNA
jgi:hypothetical protein